MTDKQSRSRTNDKDLWALIPGSILLLPLAAFIVAGVVGKMELAYSIRDYMTTGWTSYVYIAFAILVGLPSSVYACYVIIWKDIVESAIAARDEAILQKFAPMFNPPPPRWRAIAGLVIAMALFAFMIALIVFIIGLDHGWWRLMV